MAEEEIGTWKHRGALQWDDNSTAETTVDATPRRLTAASTKGIEVGLTVDTANNQIVCAAAGDYLVTSSVSFSGTLSKTFKVEVYKDTTGLNDRLERKLGTGGDVGNASTTALVTLAVGEAISLYQYSTDGGSAMTVTNAQLIVVRVS